MILKEQNYQYRKGKKMKRSEMLKILTTPITVSGEVDIDLWLFNDEAEAILSMIEKAGMTVKAGEWEPEDEEK